MSFPSLERVFPEKGSGGGAGLGPRSLRDEPEVADVRADSFSVISIKAHGNIGGFPAPPSGGDEATFFPRGKDDRY